MNHERGRELLRDERARVESLLAARALTQLEERSFESDSIDPSDAAEPLTAQGIDDALHARFVQRLHALDGADERLANGTYGESKGGDKRGKATKIVDI